MPDVTLNDNPNNYTDPAGLSNRIFGLGGDDTLRGADGNDTLVGGAGNDFLVGGSGNDVFDGTAGGTVREFDIVSYLGTGGTQGVVVNLATGIGTDTFGNTDTFIGIEEVRGSSFVDRLTGGNVANDFYEAFIGFGGNDTINGGSGFDEVRYDRDANEGGGARVTVNLATGAAIDGFGNRDTLVGVEAARGTSLGDVFFGNDGNNQFTGGAGNDTISGGLGYDEIRYDRDANGGGTGAAVVNLQTGLATDGFGNTDTLSGIETVRGTAQADIMTGSNRNGIYGEFFYGFAGNDRFVGSSQGDDYHEVRYDRDENLGGTSAVTVNLGTGVAIDGFGNTDTLVNIDGAQGTRFADTLRGSANNLRLINGLSGLDGVDTLDGAGGIAEVRYDRDADHGGTARVSVNLVTGQARDGFGNLDVLIGIQAARGTALGDVFIGNGSDNLFNGLGGNDTINGGAGFDEIRYQWDFADGGTAGIVANLATGTVTDGFGATDTISGIEGVLATNSADRLIGSAADNRFSGLGGNDTIDGGGGIDTLRLQNDDLYGATVGATVNLTTGTATDGFGSTDTLVSIENVLGSIFNDRITGSAVANALSGDDGNDVLIGAAGNDTLDGGAGSDHIYGGAGADRHVGGDGLDYARYDDGNYGNLTIRLDAPSANTGAALGDTYSGIEGVVGGVGNDTIYGDAAVNRLLGMGGNDTIDGRAGSDYLEGGAGVDNYRFSTALGSTNVDTIAGFQHGVDNVMLHSSIFAGIGPTLDASEFGTTPAAGRLIVYLQSSGQLFYDAAGAGSGAGPVLFATVAAGTVLDINDFVMV